VIEARTKIPWAGQVVPLHKHEGLSMRALVAQARTHLAGYARRHTGGFAQGFVDGVARWGLDERGSLFVVPAKDKMAVTVDAQAQAAAGEGASSGAGGTRCPMARAGPRGPSGWRAQSWGLPG
jgi:hypothetical protein